MVVEVDLTVLDLMMVVAVEVELEVIELLVMVLLHYKDVPYQV